jgi:hypothetical protein
VNILQRCRIVDALGEWGTHNTSWRAGREISDAEDGVNFVLTYYAELVGRILAAFPFACLRTEILAEDLPLLQLHDHRPADVLTTLRAVDSREGDYVRMMTAAEAPVMGPLTSTCQAAVVDGTFQLQPPFLIFDGWHRAAAWILQGRAGKVYPITANVILT